MSAKEWDEDRELRKVEKAVFSLPENFNIKKDNFLLKNKNVFLHVILPFLTLDQAFRLSVASRSMYLTLNINMIKKEN
jgi:hypothetical protein